MMIKISNFRIILIIPILVACTQNRSMSGEIRKSNIQSIDSLEMTNNFYDNTETVSLTVNDLTVEGEIVNRGKVDFSKMLKHSVIVKETLFDSIGGDIFVGAYRYDGYSLFDILNERIIKKANVSEFNPVIDLFIEIENAKGEKVVFSWGEVYYPTDLHKVIIASNVSRIVPSRTKDLWPLPVDSKIVAATDLVTERNISAPVKITVKSYPASFKVNRNISPLYSSQIDLYSSSVLVGRIDSLPEKITNVTFNTVFYGRGKGIHSTTPFTGFILKDILLKYYPISRDNIKSGIMCIVGKDGYRCAVTYSELFNRNDQREYLLVKAKGGEDGGLFRVFAASDFFSDRAIKSLSEIHLIQ
jgi:hypothetical protein